jgi:hypothetical protein
MAIPKEISLGSAAFSAGIIKNAGTVGKYDSKLFYNLNPSRWYKTYPFYFEIRSQSGDTLISRIYLPIPPQSLTIQDMSTSEAHATIGGVVEETSETVFHMITLVGTTGMSSNDINLSTKNEDEQLKVMFRKYVDDLIGRSNPVSKLIGNFGDALLDNTIGIAEPEGRLPYQDFGSSVPTAKDDSIVTNLDAGTDRPGSKGMIANFVNSFTASLSNDSRDLKTPFANGFTWSHALRQMFLVYKREKSKNPDLALFFIDVKRNTRYRCIAKSVQLQDSAQNPFMTNYNIVLKCWELSNVEVEPEKAEINRFAKGGDLAEVYTANATALVSRVGNVMRNWGRRGDIAGAMVKTSTSSVI